MAKRLSKAAVKKREKEMNKFSFGQVFFGTTTKAKKRSGKRKGRRQK